MIKNPKSFAAALNHRNDFNCVSGFDLKVKGTTGFFEYLCCLLDEGFEGKVLARMVRAYCQNNGMLDCFKIFKHYFSIKQYLPKVEDAQEKMDMLQQDFIPSQCMTVCDALLTGSIRNRCFKKQRGVSKFFAVADHHLVKKALSKLGDAGELSRPNEAAAPAA